MKLRTSIIPDKQLFLKNGDAPELNLKAICIFAATGFFLEKDTYFSNLIALQPATDYDVGDDNNVTNSEIYWKWQYEPRDITLEQATEEFADLFEKISIENLSGKKIILPLSGGLDSRTQAAALTGYDNISAYSYKFANSFDEAKYGKEISKVNSFQFHQYEIPKGYLWNVIGELGEINGCYADFVSPRQMAVIHDVKKLGNIFYLGHWGDVLFDDVGVDGNIPFDEQLKTVRKKLIKKGGEELAQMLWESWGIEGSFNDYFDERISALLSDIKIDDANARIRAFKSMYWAPRWTSANMNVFSHFNEIYLPYYDDRMCRFICTVPESLLSGRKIQINYIKLRNPALASIPWQNVDPLNLYNYEKFNSKGMLLKRAFKKGKRILNEKTRGKALTIRNWEIQFVGEENDKHLQRHLFENKSYSEFIPVELVRNIYKKFKEIDSVVYSHPLSMLLTLSEFCRQNQSTLNEVTINSNLLR